MSAQHTPDADELFRMALENDFDRKPALLASLDDQAERAVQALLNVQRQRNEMREERDAAMATVESLIDALTQIAYSDCDAKAVARAAIAKAAGSAS